MMAAVRFFSSAKKQTTAAPAASEDSAAPAPYSATGKASSPLLTALLERKPAVALKNEFSPPDLNGVTTDSQSALHLAAGLYTNAEAMDFLLGHTRNVDVTDGVQSTPLHVAARAGNSAAASSLLRAGANPSAITTDRHNALHFCGLGSAEMKQEHLLIAEALLSANTNLEQATTEGNTPLHIAADNDRPELVTMLLAHGADMMAVNYFGNSPMHFAAHQSSPAMAQLLFDELVRREIPISALSNMQNKRGYSPLHRACVTGTLDVVKCLVNHGATIDLANVDGETPIGLALFKKDAPLIAYLQEQLKVAKLHAVFCQLHSADTLRHPISFAIEKQVDSVVPSTTLSNLLEALNVKAPASLSKSPSLMKWEEFLTICDKNAVFAKVSDEQVERSLKDVDTRKVSFDYKETLLSSKFHRLQSAGQPISANRAELKVDVRTLNNYLSACGTPAKNLLPAEPSSLTCEGFEIAMLKCRSLSSVESSALNKTLGISFKYEYLAFDYREQAVKTACIKIHDSMKNKTPGCQLIPFRTVAKFASYLEMVPAGLDPVLFLCSHDPEIKDKEITPDQVVELLQKSEFIGLLDPAALERKMRTLRPQYMQFDFKARRMSSEPFKQLADRNRPKGKVPVKSLAKIIHAVLDSFDEGSGLPGIFDVNAELSCDEFYTVLNEHCILEDMEDKELDDKVRTLHLMHMQHDYKERVIAKAFFKLDKASTCELPLPTLVELCEKLQLIPEGADPALWLEPPEKSSESTAADGSPVYTLPEFQAMLADHKILNDVTEWQLDERASAIEWVYLRPDYKQMRLRHLFKSMDEDDQDNVDASDIFSFLADAGMIDQAAADDVAAGYMTLSADQFVRECIKLELMERFTSVALDEALKEEGYHMPVDETDKMGAL